MCINKLNKQKMEENKERIILGLDLSTACIGVSLVKYDGENFDILKVSHVKPKVPNKIKGTEALFYKAKIFKEQFIQKNIGIGITDVVIEEPLPTSPHTRGISTLLRFNGMLSQSIYEATGIVPVYISSYDARKYAFPELMAVRKFNKNEEIYPLAKLRKAIKNNELVLFGGYPFSCQKKYILWNKISEMYPYIEWEYDKKGELTTENFDASDSLICIIGQIEKEKYEGDEPKIIKFDEETIEGKEKITKFTYTVSFCGKEFEKTLDV